VHNNLSKQLTRQLALFQNNSQAAPGCDKLRNTIEHGIPMIAGGIRAMMLFYKDNKRFHSKVDGNYNYNGET